MEKKLEELLENDDELLMNTVNEIVLSDGSLDWLEYHENNEDFFDTYFTNKFEVARAISFGNYKFTDKYVQFNAYGNLDSVNESGYIDKCEYYLDEIIEEIIKHKDTCEFNNRIVNILESEVE